VPLHYGVLALRVITRVAAAEFLYTLHSFAPDQQTKRSYTVRRLRRVFCGTSQAQRGNWAWRSIHLTVGLVLGRPWGCACQTGKVFEPLFTTKARGIGLGLALSRMLVEKHGGTIEVQSELAKGTTFTVKLPMVAAPGAARDAAPGTTRDREWRKSL